MRAEPSRSRASAGATTLVAAFTLIALLTPTGASSSGPSFLSAEVNIAASYAERRGWDSALPSSQRSSVGFEYWKKLSGDSGDILAVDIQARLAVDSTAPEDQQLALEVHNAWAELKLGLGRNVRVGRFAFAHGLEPVVDTHGTLLQTLAGMDVGFKKDWGIGYRGIAGPFDVETALQLGSGMGPKADEGSYLLTFRLGRPPGPGLRYGLSFLRGRVLQGGRPRTLPAPEYAEGTVTKTRAGASAELEHRAFALMAELSVGTDDGHAARGALVQAQYKLPSRQRLAFQAQARYWTCEDPANEAEAAVVAIGASYEISRGWTLRTALFVDLAGENGGQEKTLGLQAYYFGA